MDRALLIVFVFLVGARSVGSGCRVNDRRSRSRSDAVGGIEAVVASWTIGDEEDGCALHLTQSPAGARMGRGTCQRVASAVT